MWLNFSPSIQSAEERRSQISVMAVEIKIIHMYVYQKFTKCPAFGIFKIHIRTLQKHTYLEKARERWEILLH